MVYFCSRNMPNSRSQNQNSQGGVIFQHNKKKMASGLIYFSRMDTGAAVQRRETARKAACFLENVRIWITQ